jgi:hypothetical protein
MQLINQKKPSTIGHNLQIYFCIYETTATCRYSLRIMCKISFFAYIGLVLGSTILPDQSLQRRAPGAGAVDNIVANVADDAKRMHLDKDDFMKFLDSFYKKDSKFRNWVDKDSIAPVDLNPGNDYWGIPQKRIAEASPVPQRLTRSRLGKSRMDNLLEMANVKSINDLKSLSHEQKGALIDKYLKSEFAVRVNQELTGKKVFTVENMAGYTPFTGSDIIGWPSHIRFGDWNNIFPELLDNILIKLPELEFQHKRVFNVASLFSAS